jgi:hypothetical protein
MPEASPSERMIDVGDIYAGPPPYYVLEHLTKDRCGSHRLR